MDKDEAKAAKRAAKEAKKRAAAEEQPEEEPPAKEKKSKKARRESEGGDDGPAAAPPAHKQDAAETGIGSGRIKDLWKNGEAAWRDGTLDSDYLVRNPDNITRLFCGNLKLDVTEEALRGHIPGITFIRWQKDKTTKAFYGSTFLEMKDPKAAALAVAMDRTKFQGRPLKIYYCPPRPGDVWPPVERGGAANSGPSNGKDRNTRARTPKPPGGKKLYMGNLSYTIDDDTVVEFFKECGELRGLRWLVNSETQEFRGGGFVEFHTSEAADAAIKLDGTDLLGRPIRLDWTL